MYKVNLGIVLVVIMLNSSCTGTKKNSLFPFPYANTDRSVKFVGSEQCKPCHEKIYNSYKKSEMGRSMYPMDIGRNIVQSMVQPPIYDARLNFWYEMIERSGKLYQREYRKEKTGVISHDRFVEAQYAMGSGNNLQMYFYEDGGMLYEHPLTFYTHKKKFDLSPGYREFGNVRFTRFASFKCISCHNSYLTPDSMSVDRYRKPFDFGIGCERCHGPGELHIKAANGEIIDGLSEDALTIINPKKLPHQQQLDVCQQCHLQGKAWVLNDSKQDYFDFRPGELLSSHRSVYFKAETAQEVIEVGDSPQRLSMSRCYLQSSGSMTCITCHDPHYSIKTFSSDHYNAKCKSCHTVASLEKKKLSQKHSEAANCISCHMNRTGNDNTLHGVSNTDHWIRSNANKTKIKWSSLRKPSLQPLTQLKAFLSNNDSLSDERIAEAYLYYFKEHDSRSAYLDSSLYYANKTIITGFATERSYSVAAQVYSQRDQYKDSEENYRVAISLNPTKSELRFQFAELLSSMNNLAAGLNELRTAISLRPHEPKYLESMGIVQYKLNNISAAQRLFEQAIRTDRQNGEVFFYLGNIHAMNNRDPLKSQAYYRQALNLLPDLNNAHLNLGNTFLLLQQPDSAISEYALELRQNPHSVSAMINMGKAYALKGNSERAEFYNRKAMKIDPTAMTSKKLPVQ